MSIGALSTPQPALAVGFLACLLWIALCAHGLLDLAPLPSEIKVLVGLAIPVVGVSTMLHRTGLFAGVRDGVRIIRLVGLSLALLSAAFTILFMLAVLLFAFGILSPP